MNSAYNIKRNEKDSIAIFEERTLENDFRTIIPSLKPGIRVLDVGCGTGAIPDTMKVAYNAFLAWRSENGLNNQIAEDLPDYFKAADFSNIQIFKANEIYDKESPYFMSKLEMWEKVVAMTQIQEEGYLEKESLKQALLAYGHWKENEARRMVLNLKEIRGIKLSQ